MLHCGKVFILSLFISILFFSHPVLAAKTGSFDASITFMGKPRSMACYVPTSYDSTKTYRLMICLHGLGDNIDNYRNYLISLGWPAQFPNTIFICPEAYVTTADFYQPAGDEAIIQKSIDFARSGYNIDSSNIILQGFSLGGRAALRYGLDHYSQFKGLLLNTPAVQGIKEALNQSIYYTFTYSNASKIPIYITHGTADPNYEGPIDTMFRQLVLNEGRAWYYNVPGMGHAIPGSKINVCLTLFNTPDTADYDLDVQAVMLPRRSCNTSVNAQVLIRNIGKQTITSASLQYTFNGNPATYNWTGTLASFQYTLVQLPAFTASAGSQSLDVKVLSLNGGTTDQVSSNNEKSTPFEIVTKGMSLPVKNGFDGPLLTSGGWVMNPSGEYISQWFLDSSVHRGGAASIGAFNTILVFDNAGRRDEMLSPVLDLTNTANPQVKFDVAYNYHHYTPSILGIDSVFADTLEVMVSTNCGQNWTLLYKKGGKQLATFHDPILNPTSFQADFIVPADSNWRTEQIDLSKYASANEAVVKFSYKSALGGSIYIDNFKIGDYLGIAEKQSTSNFRIYPNPAGNALFVDAGAAHIQKINVLDISGKILQSTEVRNFHDAQVPIDISNLPKGLYLLEIVTENAIKTEKFMHE
jgi:predicted esterase